MQAVDFTALSAAVADLQSGWLPARVEQVRQEDAQTIKLLLRTFKTSRWLVASCHPQAARLHLGEVDRSKVTRFPFGSTAHQYLSGKVLVNCEQPAWERVVRLGFARRPEEQTELDLYVEAMGKYSNLVLADANGRILALAHPVTAAQSRVRPLQIGDPYTPPPPLKLPIPTRHEGFEDWKARLTVVPGPVAPALFKVYRGVSQSLANQLLAQLGIGAGTAMAALDTEQWQAIHALWDEWLRRLGENDYQPGLTGGGGYTVVGFNLRSPVEPIHTLLDRYYRDALNAELFHQRRSRLQQVLKAALAKAVKRQTAFEQMMENARQVDRFKSEADLLMAYLHEGKPGLTTIELPDFTSEEPVAIRLDPAKDMVGNAQAYYKLHRKAKRANQAVEPLLTEARAEVHYLEQVSATVELLNEPRDLEALGEVEEELTAEGYLERSERSKPVESVQSPFHQFALPTGHLVLAGRNNRQNERLLQTAAASDLWLHAQEIPGSHVLLKLPPGALVEASELQWAANVAAYYSRARQSTHVPVIYTERRHVRKLKGARPGLVNYREEQVIWGNPAELPEENKSLATP